VEQIELGTGCAGVVNVTAMATWAWETDWTVAISYRRSGSDTWAHTKVTHVSDPDVGEAMRQLAAEAMGYV